MSLAKQSTEEKNSKFDQRNRTLICATTELANVAARIRTLISRDGDRASVQVISVSLLPSIERGQEQTECDSTMIEKSSRIKRARYDQ